jgi:hypothetical protein
VYLTKLKSLSVLSKTWPVALNECLFTTPSKSFLYTTCFLTLLCPLLLSLFFILLTTHLMTNGKVNGVLTLRHSLDTELLHHVKLGHRTEIRYRLYTSLSVNPHLGVTQRWNMLQNNQLCI